MTGRRWTTTLALDIFPGDDKRGFRNLKPPKFRIDALVALISLGQSRAVYGRAADALPPLKEGTDLLKNHQPGS